jgi:hypothetical protein
MSNDFQLHLRYTSDKSVGYSMNAFKQLSEKEMLELYTHLYGSAEQGSKYYYEQQELMQRASAVVGVSHSLVNCIIAYS